MVFIDYREDFDSTTIHRLKLLNGNNIATPRKLINLTRITVLHSEAKVVIGGTMSRIF